MFTLLLIALVLFLLGLFSAAKILFWIAVILAVLSCFGGFGPVGWGWGPRSRRY